MATSVYTTKCYSICQYYLPSLLSMLFVFFSASGDLSISPVQEFCDIIDRGTTTIGQTWLYHGWTMKVRTTVCIPWYIVVALYHGKLVYHGLSTMAQLCMQHGRTMLLPWWNRGEHRWYHGFGFTMVDPWRHGRFYHGTPQLVNLHRSWSRWKS